jgi:hypothetical protein
MNRVVATLREKQTEAAKQCSHRRQPEGAWVWRVSGASFAWATDTLQAASSALSPLVQRVITTRIESHTLVGLSDALLPKLISGELRVKDAERLLEETTE